MFETESFKKELTNAVSTEAANNKQRYQSDIIDYLQGLASQNESTLMEREVRKAVSARRGVPDALNSARDLTREACKYAAADKRTLLARSDIEKAYKAQFCRWWPFCKE